MNVGAQGGQKKALDPSELEFQVVVSLLKWLPCVFARAASATYC